MKKHGFFTGFRGNIVTDITGNIFSDQGMLFGTFLMKNIFINFPTPILNHGFCSISLKISCFLQQTWRLCTTTADKTYENHWIFWWNHAKNIVQNRSWKIDENIFHQKCPKQHSLVTESVSGDACDDISSKNDEKFMLFLTCPPLWGSL